MRWFKFLSFIAALFFLAYVWVMHFYSEREHFVIEKEINYPIEKVFPQFNNFQDYTRWNVQFLSKDKYQFVYFFPYEGEGSSISYTNTKDVEDSGQIFIRRVNPNKIIEYDVHKKRDKTPYKVVVRFIPKGQKTRVIWSVETPKIPVMMRLTEQFSEKEINNEIEHSVGNLSALLSGKVEKEVLFNQIKYDSIIIEEQEERLLLGINVSTNNKKGNLFKNINRNHNKLVGYVVKDLGKREDEFGQPVLLMDVNSLKSNDVSYFYGVPLSKKENISDNNFIFRKQEKTKIYSIYYRGKYENRVTAIGKLLGQIKKDSLQRHSMLEELFIEYPSEDKEVVLKISLPILKNE